MSTPRQQRLCALAARIWPGVSVEVVSPDEGHVHVWDEQGKTLLTVEHPFADAVMALLAGDIAASSVGVCLDIADYVIRDRAHRHGLDVIGWREGQIILWDDEGKIGDGLTLRGALDNLDSRRPEEQSSTRLKVESPLPSPGRYSLGRGKKP